MNNPRGSLLAPSLSAFLRSNPDTCCKMRKLFRQPELTGSPCCHREEIGARRQSWGRRGQDQTPVAPTPSPRWQGGGRVKAPEIEDSLKSHVSGMILRVIWSGHLDPMCRSPAQLQVRWDPAASQAPPHPQSRQGN